MSTHVQATTTGPVPSRIPPPTKHQLAIMIWLSVFPTLTVLNLAFGGWLRTLSPVLRTFILATVAVPIVMYGLMPQMHRIRVRLIRRRMGEPLRGGVAAPLRGTHSDA
jgi:antibiotic biosynthesis monooxygenase (ABM) superfamily enzyme